MDWWSEVVAAALVGTERRPPPLTPAAGPLAELVGRLDQTSPERALLGAAAVIAAHRRAGRRLTSDRRPLPEPAPAEEAPVCGPAAARRLARLLVEENKERLLGEWLEAVAAAGRIVPPAHLPALLETGRRESDLQAAIRPVLGARGRWLAAQNPAWEYAVATDLTNPDEVWLSGARAARLTLLRELRQRDPARARDLLTSTWSGEDVDQRAAFLEALAVGLSLEDEPFLEAALDDRRKPVRDRAAVLLSRLPESRLVARMKERLTDTFSIGPVPGRGRAKKPVPGLIVALPTARDAAMARDGIEAKPSAGTGERAWWLGQMMQAVPPAFWSARLGQSPAALIALAAAGEWGEAVLIDAWAIAARRHRDADWAEAVLDHTAWEEHEELFQVLPPARQQALVRRLVAAPLASGSKHDPGHWLIAAARLPLGPDLGRMVLERLRRSLAAGALKNDWRLWTALTELVHRLPISLADEAATGWPTTVKHWNLWAQPIQELTTTLQFRAEMQKEIVE